MKYSMDELLPIVQKLTEKYTGKSSTSITYEKAQQLMGAIIYSIRENDMGSSEYGIRAGKLDAAEAYHNGCQLVIKKVLMAKTIYEEMIEHFDSYGLSCYYDTVVKGMPIFFVQYDARFYPQDHILTLDYPLIDMDYKLSGIDLIHPYINCVYLEQNFLASFPRKYVIEALKDYHRNYTDLFINVSSVVIRSVLIRMMDRRIVIREESVGTLEDKVNNLLSKFIWEELKKRIEDDSLCTEIENYLRKDIHSFVVELRNMEDSKIL